MHPHRFPRPCRARPARRRRPGPALLALAASLAGPPAHAGMVVTFEAAGTAAPDAAALCAGAADCVVGVEGFDALPRGRNRHFTTDFGTGGRITGRYRGADIVAANQYGGAGGHGGHVETFARRGFSIDLATLGVPGVNYFGFWLSALDAGNQLEFVSRGDVIFRFGPQQFLDLVAGCPSDFCGNPFAPFAGRNAREPYAFLNFRLTDGFFDRVQFYQSRSGGYESDNHSVGFVRGASGSPIPAPPGAGLALLGLGLIAAHRRRRRALPRAGA